MQLPATTIANARRKAHRRQELALSIARHQRRNREQVKLRDGIRRARKLLDVAYCRRKPTRKKQKAKKKHFAKFFSLRSANLTFDVRDPFAAETKIDRKPCGPHVFGTALLESGVWKRRRLALCWRDASKVWRRGGVELNWNRSSSRKQIDE